MRTLGVRAANVRLEQLSLATRVGRWILASLLVPGAFVAAVTARADGPWLPVWLWTSAGFGVIYFVPLVMPTRDPRQALRSTWPFSHPRAWSMATSVVAAVALALNLSWSFVDDDLLYASLGLAAVGLLMLAKVAKESLTWTFGLAALLLVPYAHLAYLIATTE